ncbi:hypothetical protein [Actinacidiphila sp. bgisy160]|uniref:hypothetical protein n=1 Tax=Actinacidiphila sp. bgisy160 TaxID=3413796 RepID=UPI003D74C326
MAGTVLLVLGGVAEGSAVGAPIIYDQAAPDVRLNVRNGPGSGYRIVTTSPYGAEASVFRQTQGTTVSGYYGTSNIWDCIGDGQFVSDAYVRTGSDGYIAPRCS